MRASLVNATLESSTDFGLKDARLASSPASSSDKSFERVLAHARKPASTEESSQKGEKTKSSNAKQSKSPVTPGDQDKKIAKADSKDAEDADAKDASADSPQDDASSSPNDKPTPAAENSAGSDPTDNDPELSEDAADISTTAQEAAAAQPAATTSQSPVSAQKSAKSQTTGSNNGKSADGNGNNSAISTNAVQAITTGTRQNKSKGDSATSAGNSKTSAGDALDSRTSAAAAAGPSPALPAALAEPVLRASKEQSLTTTQVAANPSSHPDDADTDTPTTASSTAAPAQVDATQIDPTGVDTASDNDPSHSLAPAAAAVDQSSFATFTQSLASAGSTSTVAGTSAAKAGTTAPNAGAKFVADNHPSIVQSVKTQLLPTGGTMRLRLDPPELGAMQVSVHVKDGVVTASFETNNDQATKMLSHSLGQLKQSLEAQGITVGKMHVQQAPRNQTAGDGSTDSDSDSDPSKENTSSSQQDEQRRQTLRRMWEKLALGGDPLDLVA